MIGFAVVFSLPRISFFMTLVALINVVFTAIAVVTVIAMVTAITMITAAVAIAGLAKTGVAIIDSESAAASAACRTFLLDMIFS
jgi:hypothetical protein